MQWQTNNRAAAQQRNGAAGQRKNNQVSLLQRPERWRSVLSRRNHNQRRDTQAHAAARKVPQQATTASTACTYQLERPSGAAAHRRKAG